MNTPLHEQILSELAARGPLGRAALSEILGERPEAVTRTLASLSHEGLVTPAGDGRWASLRSLKPTPGPLPEGEGNPRVERIEPADLDDLVAGDPDREGEDVPRGVPGPPFGPEQRGPVWDLVGVDIERLHGELFNATGTVRRALDLWVATDPVAYRLRTASRALAYAARLLAELDERA